MLAGLDRVLFRRQAEGIPAHRMQHIEAAHALVARDDIGRGVAFGMADVQARAARIREHVEDVEFRLWRDRSPSRPDWAREKSAASSQMALPFRLELIEGIRFAALAHETRMDRINRIHKKSLTLKLFVLEIICGSWLI